MRGVKVDPRLEDEDDLQVVDGVDHEEDDEIDDDEEEEDEEEDDDDDDDQEEDDEEEDESDDEDQGHNGLVDGDVDSDDDDENNDNDDDDDDGEEEEEADNEEEEVDDDEVDGDAGSKGAGWADAMRRVLNTGKQSGQASMLSKAKKDDQNPSKSRTQSSNRKISIDAECRQKVNITLNRSKEKMLCRLATKGVVQLFNAVRDQQRNLNQAMQRAGKSTSKRERVIKDIMDNNEEPKWKVFKQDYLMNASVKEWNKEEELD